MGALAGSISSALSWLESFYKPTLCKVLKMKIFNWVHRRVNTGPISSVSLHPQKGHEVKMNKQEVEMKERSVVKLSVLEREETLLGWGDGLLAIGTLGFHADHLPYPGFIINPRLSYQNSSNSVSDTRDDSVSDDQEYLDSTIYMTDLLAGENDDEDPLVLNAYNHHELEEVENEIIQNVETADLDHDTTRSQSVKSDRTTLFDLFEAEPNDSFISKKCRPKWGSAFKDRTNKEDKQIMGKPKKFPTSFSAKLVQKLTPGPEVQAIKNINHMMRKMMKKKIHPELPRQKSTTSKMDNKGIIMPLPSKDEIQVKEGTSYCFNQKICR